jgi:hypothetical protein
MQDSEDGPKFKMYFTEQITSAPAQRLLTYMKDGGFLDSQTQEITMEIPTLNSNLNIFAIFTFTFTWQVF